VCDDRPVPAEAIRWPVAFSTRVLLWPLAATVGLWSVLIARNNPEGGFGGESALNGILELCAGWSMLAAGLVLLHGPAKRVGVLFAAAGCSWFVLDWNNPASSSIVFTVGLVCSALTPALVAHAALAYPGGKLRSAFERTAVAATYLATGLILGLAPALVFEPALAGCSQCPPNLLAVRSSARLFENLNELGLYLGLATLTVVASSVAWRIAHSSVATLRRDGPVLVAALAFLLLVAWDYQHSFVRGSLGNDPFDTRLWRLEAVALCALAAGVAWGRFLQRRARSSVAQLVIELAHAPRPGGVRDAIADELGDPALELAYVRSRGSPYVDASGEPTVLEPRPGRVVTPVLSNGRQLAALGHDVALLRNPALVSEVVAAARLAIENEQLEAEVRAQLAALRRSRARIVEAGDLERLRLERDLHDATQQPLIGLLFALRIAHGKLPENADGTVAARLTEATTELELALAELRELAHGIHPVSLTEEGFTAALESLAERSSTPLTLGGLPRQRCAPAIEAVAYLVVAETVKGVEICNGSAVQVEASLRGQRLFLEVVAEGWNEDDAERETRLIDLADRVGAVDGRLRVETSDDRTQLVVELPCE
jgi:signal transduction histidine kinase